MSRGVPSFENEGREEVELPTLPLGSAWSLNLGLGREAYALVPTSPHRPAPPYAPLTAASSRSADTPKSWPHTPAAHSVTA